MYEKGYKNNTVFDIQMNSSHSETLDSLNIQNEITQHAPTSEDISYQVKQLSLEPEPDLSIHSIFEDSIWPISETTTDVTLN